MNDYWDWVHQNSNAHLKTDYPDESARDGQLEHDADVALERLMELRGRAGVMRYLSEFIGRHRLDQFAGMKVAAE